MSTAQAEIGMCFDRSFPASFVTEVARRLEDGGADQLWIIEDCFYTAGVSLATSALTVTDRLRVGLGILPAVARNPAITAMELATLSQLAPGRLLPGIGHGVQSWMAQMGARTPSPLTTLEEVLVAVRQLLAGEEVTVHGRHVELVGVRLDQPPAEPPPLLAGVRGSKSLALAGRSADGVVLAEPASPSYVRWALEHAGHPADFHVAVYAAFCIEKDRRSAYESLAPWLAQLLDAPGVAFQTLPFFDDLLARYTARGQEGLVTMPSDWWTEIGPIGTLDDALAHLEALDAAGVDSIGLFPAPDIDVAREQLSDVVTLAGLRR